MRPAIFAVLAIGLAGVAVVGVASEEGCTKQQGVILESGIPTDVQTIGCIVSTAISTGGNLLAVAAACETDIETAAGILWEAGTAKAADATATQSVPAVVATKAFAEARERHLAKAARR